METVNETQRINIFLDTLVVDASFGVLTIRNFRVQFMGKDVSIAKSKLVFQAAYYKAAYEALDFCDNEDKTDQDNLIDCLQDFNIVCVEKTPVSIICMVDDSDSDDNFDWSCLSGLAEFLEEGSFIEENIYDGPQLLIGTIKVIDSTKKWVRDFYELKRSTEGLYIRGEFIENFDVDLDKD